MTGIVSYGYTTPPAQLPVAIDYPAALALRQMAAENGRVSAVPAGTEGQRPAALCAGSAPQDAVHYPLEYRRAH